MSSSIWDKDGISALTIRVKTLEETVHEYEIFELIESSLSGTVITPEHGIIIPDQYPDGADCIIVEVDISGKPTEVPARDVNGNPITSTLDSNGNYVLSGTPSAYPVAIIWQVQLAEKYKTLELIDSKILDDKVIDK